jgi:hypothetical protein
MMKPLFLAFSLIMYAVSAPQTANATIPSGCVGTFETGVANAVGWIDAGVMLGNEQATAPERFIVEAPDGTVTTYLNGDGLTPPTGIMPIWFAPAEQLGDYTVRVDGEECTVSLTGLVVSSEPPSLIASTIVATQPQSESGIGSPFGTLALITVGVVGLLLFARQWRQA